jgi:hypothetical protein
MGASDLEAVCSLPLGQQFANVGCRVDLGWLQAPDQIVPAKAAVGVVPRNGGTTIEPTQDFLGWVHQASILESRLERWGLVLAATRWREWVFDSVLTNAGGLLPRLVFFGSAAAAERAGFRPCLRCRPETVPGSPAWSGTATTVARGMRLSRKDSWMKGRLPN